MSYFNEENLNWLVLLVKQAVEKTNDKVKTVKLKSLLEKVEGLKSHTLKININANQIKNIEEVLNELELLTKKYIECSDITDLNMYDELKKGLTSKLEFLSTYKVIFNEEINNAEEILKKEIRIKVTMDIKDEHGISFAQADKMVEMDTRYTILRDQVHYLKMFASKIKTKYEFYSQMWQMIFQSVSTASKEKYARNNE